MELPKDMTMVNYEVTTLKRDFNDMFKGTDMRCSGRRLDLSLKNCWPTSFHLNFSFSWKTLSFDLLRGCWPLSSWWNLSMVWRKKPLGFHEKAMHLSWSSLVFLLMRIGKWPPKHAIFINYLCQLNSIPLLMRFFYSH